MTHILACLGFWLVAILCAAAASYLIWHVDRVWAPGPWLILGFWFILCLFIQGFTFRSRR